MMVTYNLIDVIVRSLGNLHGIVSYVDRINERVIAKNVIHQNFVAPVHRREMILRIPLNIPTFMDMFSFFRQTAG
jgi:hypothetical protein